MAYPAQALVLPKLKNILFPTDFSPCSQAAVLYVRAIAQMCGATVHVLYVIGPHPRVGPLGSPYIDVSSEEGAAERMLQLLACPAFNDIQCTQTTKWGMPGEVIVRSVSDRDIDLIVLGTHGRQGLKYVFLGSVAEYVFRHTACPVLTVGPQVHAGQELGRGGMFLFATDFSSASQHALQYALSLARMSSARLLLLHAIAPGHSESSWKYSDQAVMDARLKLVKLVADQPDIHPEVVARYGAAAGVILDTAAQKNAKLILMGAHRGPVHAPWAVAHTVVSRAPCAVLTVRA